MKPRETMVREMAGGESYRVVAVDLHNELVKVVRLRDGMPLVKTAGELGLRLN